MRTLALSRSMLLASAIGLALTGCGGGGDGTETNTTNPVVSTTDITVERGPLLHASVRDAAGNIGVHQGNGIYRFRDGPVYPISTAGGFIDVNRNSAIDAGDVRAGDLVMNSGSGGAAVTLASTLASNEELKTRLLAMGFTELQLLNNTPGQDRMIAALSDEIYRFAVENGLGDVSKLTAGQFDALVPAIQDRIAAYRISTASVAQLEQQLMTELVDKVAMLDADEAAGLTGQSDSQLLIIGLPAASLSDEQKSVLAYMWNEEKLAKDVYLALDALYPTQQLYNIATNSEAQHQASVAALLEKYDLNVWEPLNTAVGFSAEALAAIPAGGYTLTDLQGLYDMLYAKGSASARDSLEVGCMVEVTDVNDLDRDIALVTDVPDIKTVFENLRAGSYNHYWAFDTGLKNMGVTDGCCSLGADFCRPDYPNSANGQGSGDGMGNPNGRQR